MFFLKYAFENFVLKIIHLESLESKSRFFKIICNNFFSSSHPTQFSIKTTILSKTQIQACGPK